MSTHSLTATELVAQTSGFSMVYLLWLLIPVTILGTLFLVFQHLAVRRDFQHHERIKAIEAGLDWQDSKADKRSERHAYQSFWIAFWLVICGCGAPFYCVSHFVGADTDVRIAAIGWGAAGLTAIVSSIGAVFFNRQSQARRMSTK